MEACRMDKIRLSKLMSERGLCSRREADKLIEKGLVMVDGDVVETLGTRVARSVDIRLADSARASLGSKVTIMLNKPVGYVSGQPEKNYPPAIRLIKPATRFRGDRIKTRFNNGHLNGLVAAGRLDIDSQGLLILTQDGRVAKALIGPDNNVQKEYLVRIGQGFKNDQLQRLRHGLELDGKKLKQAIIEKLNDEQIKMVLTEGRKRQIRRMCRMVGLDVTGLKRVRIGPLLLGALPEGSWSYVNPDFLLQDRESSPAPGGAAAS
jgi:23S rRNA pseudouridine2604 synthase